MYYMIYGAAGPEINWKDFVNNYLAPGIVSLTFLLFFPEYISIVPGPFSIYCSIHGSMHSLVVSDHMPLELEAVSLILAVSLTKYARNRKGLQTLSHGPLFIVLIVKSYIV